jgi:hypothetical protein
MTKNIIEFHQAGEKKEECSEMEVGPDIAPREKKGSIQALPRPLVDVVAVAILDCAAMRQPFESRYGRKESRIP